MKLNRHLLTTLHVSEDTWTLTHTKKMETPMKAKMKEEEEDDGIDQTPPVVEILGSDVKSAQEGQRKEDCIPAEKSEIYLVFAVKFPTAFEDQYGFDFRYEMTTLTDGLFIEDRRVQLVFSTCDFNKANAKFDAIMNSDEVEMIVIVSVSLETDGLYKKVKEFRRPLLVNNDFYDVPSCSSAEGKVVIN